MWNFKSIATALCVICCITSVISKIVLPGKLRYLENLLNVDAKMAKYRQRNDAMGEGVDGPPSKDWPLMLAKSFKDDKYRRMAYDSLSLRRLPPKF